MRHAFAVLVGAALMCAALAAPVRAESPVVTRLPNGLTVLVKEDDRFPLVSLRLYVHAGSAYETPEIAGLSHLLEHMVFKGTEKFPKGAVAETVERSGGPGGCSTSATSAPGQAMRMASTWGRSLRTMSMELSLR